MIITKDYNITSCDDFELGIKRDSKLHFKLSYDNSKEIKAILCVIAGLGADAQDSYKEHLATSIASKLDVAVLSVDYHCVGVNEELGAKRYFCDYDKAVFKLVCNKLGFGLDDDFDTKANDINYVEIVLKNLELHIGLLKLSGKVPMDFKAPIQITLAPARKEYQNMGIMSAMDIANALLYTKKELMGGGRSKNALPIILVGSSHGAYIADITAKIAPWLIDAVIDNSSWNLSEKITMSSAALRFIGFAREVDPQFCRASVSLEHFDALFSNTTKWTLDKSSAFWFSPSRHQIRNANHKEHLMEQSKNKKAIYIGYHSIHDTIAPVPDKIEFFKNLSELGFDATLHLIKDESDIDGKLIKNLSHGMNMSIKTLILKEVPPLLAKLKNAQKCDKKSISYSTDEWIYNFKESRNKLILSCDKRMI